MIYVIIIAFGVVAGSRSELDLTEKGAVNDFFAACVMRRFKKKSVSQGKAESMKIVLDTNVLVSALINPNADITCKTLKVCRQKF